MYPQSVYIGFIVIQIYAGSPIVRQVVRTSSPSPFLFTRHIRPMTDEVGQFLRENGAELFANVWSTYSILPSPPSPGLRSLGGQTRSPVCQYPPVWSQGASPGCDNKIPQWTYTVSKTASRGDCQPYWYNGCGASQNLYSNEWKCRLRCASNDVGTFLNKAQ